MVGCWMEQNVIKFDVELGLMLLTCAQRAFNKVNEARHPSKHDGKLGLYSCRSHVITVISLSRKLKQYKVLRRWRGSRRY